MGEDIDRLELAVYDVTLKTGKDPDIGDTPMLSTWEGVSFTFESTANAVQNKLNLIDTRLRQIDQVIQLLVTDNQRLSSEIQCQQSSQPSNVTGLSSVPSDPRVSNMERIMQMLDACLMQMETSTQRGAMTNNLPMAGSLLSELRYLQEKFKALEARITYTPIMVCSRTFLPLPDVKAWVVRHTPAGVFYF